MPKLLVIDDCDECKYLRKVRLLGNFSSKSKNLCSLTKRYVQSTTNIPRQCPLEIPSMDQLNVSRKGLYK